MPIDFMYDITRFLRPFKISRFLFSWHPAYPPKKCETLHRAKISRCTVYSSHKYGPNWSLRAQDDNNYYLVYDFTYTMYVDVDHPSSCQSADHSNLHVHCTYRTLAKKGLWAMYLTLDLNWRVGRYSRYQLDTRERLDKLYPM
jgi:hypothetical protein